MSFFDDDDFRIPWTCLRGGCRKRATAGLMCIEHFRETVLGPMRVVMASRFGLSEEEVTQHADAIVALAEATVSNPTRTVKSVLEEHPEFTALIRTRLRPNGTFRAGIGLNGVEQPDGTVKVRSFDFVARPVMVGGGRIDLPTIRDHAPVVPLDEILRVQPMTAQVPGFEIHVLSPEEIRERWLTVFDCDAYNVGTEQQPWRKGRLRMTKRENSDAWDIAFWNDGPPLTECVPALSAATNTWLASRPGLYDPIPEGTVMVTFGWDTGGGTTVAYPFCIPADRELELREKVRPTRPPAGPEYGA